MYSNSVRVYYYFCVQVMEAENERIISEAEHQRVTTLYAQVQDEVNNELKEHKRSISKSKYARHYYYYCMQYSYICT